MGKRCVRPQLAARDHQVDAAGRSNSGRCDGGSHRRFRGSGYRDIHTATIDWETASTNPTIPRGDRQFPATHTYTQAGVYTVVATVTDNSGSGDRRSSTVELIVYIVVFDPSAGFVTGGGSFTSPAGACNTAACTSLTSGKARFGFVSKAKFKGTGSINGDGSYGFMITTLDGKDVNAPGPVPHQDLGYRDRCGPVRQQVGIVR